jgi:hypothetical protein
VVKMRTEFSTVPRVSSLLSNDIRTEIHQKIFCLLFYASMKLGLVRKSVEGYGP